ncbi:MAG: acyl carrier protein [Desulfobacteraceae bacterium IS3]|nr:MAG: acyl carrier protein [Desulfobacteraceae bacterium IS3]
MYERIFNIIIQQARELNEQLTNKIPLEQGADAPLFGGDGVLDSIALVTLIVGVEQAIEDEFDTALTIADEKAMSQKLSPFRTVGSLSAYVEKLIKGEI